MCGGHSLHKKDWLKIAGGLAAISAPWTIPAIGAAMGGGAAAGATTGAAGLLGAAAPGEAVGAFTGGLNALSYGGELASVGDIGTMLGGAAPHELTGVGGLNWDKGLRTFAKANEYMRLAGGGGQGDQASQYTPMQHPQAAPAPQSDLEALYALIYPQRKRKDQNYV